MKISAHLRTVVALCLAMFATLVLADPPGRVARIAEYAGEVQIATPYERWQPVYRNHVVTAGDNLWVSEGGRVELDVGPLQVWLSGGANIYFERFDDHNLVARLASGIAAVRIRQWEPKDAMRVATDQGEVSFVQPGLYFITAGNGYNPSVVTTRFGKAELNAAGRVQWVSRGDTFAFDQNGARFDRYAFGGVPSGGFEAWVAARDRRIDRWEARNGGNFNPWMVGVRDLDDHGYWESSYEYGRVWYPNTVAANWAPYRYGRWSWVQPWGWTWVDDAPWGFAPFHYGRWVRVGGRWAWCPGSYVGRAVYAPALVTFYGGNGWSVNVSSGPTYSWVPLGWNEPFVPWYTYSPNYWRVVNRPYVRHSGDDPWRPPAYVHASVPGAVTTIAAAGLIAGRHVTQNYVRNAPEIDLRSAPPARMGEIVPQFRAARSDPNPVASVQPSIRGSAVVVEPGVSRSAPPMMGKDRAAMSAAPLPPIQPNRNIAEARVWQDPNPVAPRSTPSSSAPSMRDSVPVIREGASPSGQRVVNESQGLRVESRSDSRTLTVPSAPSTQPAADRSVAPAPKDRRERLPSQEYRSDGGAPPANAFAETRPSKPRTDKLMPIESAPVAKHDGSVAPARVAVAKERVERIAPERVQRSAEERAQRREDKAVRREQAVQEKHEKHEKHDNNAHGKGKDRAREP